jgi:hypothetical protein
LEIQPIYKTQYYLSVNSSDGGLGNPHGSGWFDKGSNVNFSVTSPTGFLLSQELDHWQGDYVGKDNPGYLVLDGPKTVVAMWRFTTVQMQLIGLVLGIIISSITLAEVSRRYLRRGGKKKDL